MSSQLHRAVELAQAGQRQEANQLLRQVVQSDPNNEVAWLWLASVAADHPEYVRALNEVLRINPNNQQAQRLLAEYQQQYSTPPPPTPYQSVSPAQPPPSTPPPIPVYRGEQQPQQPGFSSAFPRPGEPAQVRVETVQKHRYGCGGCGCGGCGLVPGCLIALIVLVILPVVACAGLSYSSTSLGPLDLPGAYLPGEFGRKTITLDIQSFEATLEVPRSWFLVETDNVWWEAMRSMLDDSLPFESTQTWEDFEQAPAPIVYILETNPEILNRAGSPLGMMYVGLKPGEYTCQAVQANPALYDEYYKYDNDLCGTRTDSVTPLEPAQMFKGTGTPGQQRTITVLVPLNAQSATEWQVFLPEDLYDDFRSDIVQMIEKAEVKQK
jgi:tetratricopeptide (TPR) repeat protein